MIESRTKNATRNIIWGMLNKFASLVFPFILRTTIIHMLGSEYLGLNSLFTSVLNVLSLAELGFGSAMVYSMYKPIVENDSKTICALLNLYKKIYRRIGIIILFLGLLLLPFISYFINGDVPTDINIYQLYLIYLGNTVASYFLFAYRTSLLSAHQRSDILSKVSTLFTVLRSLLQFILLLAFKNYYLYAVQLLICTCLINIVDARIAAKMYPYYYCKGEIDNNLAKTIKSKVFALLSVKITIVIYNSVDSIVISTFLGLVSLAKYNNYYFVMNAVSGVIVILYHSMIAGIGNSIIKESDEKNYRDYMNLSYINAWLVGFSTTCLLCLYQPFMGLWVGEELMFEFPMVILFCVYFYVHQLKSVQSTYKDAAGLWKEDMYRSYAANLFNLVTNILLVQTIGIYGVILSTISTLLIVTYPWQTWMIHNKLFHCSMKPFIFRLLIYTLVTVIACGCTYYLCSFIPDTGIESFFLKMGISCIIPNLIFLMCSWQTNEFKVMKQTILRAVKNR